MTRLLLALVALLFSLTLSISDAPVTRAVKASGMALSELSVESVYTSPTQIEKHFLPADELTLALTRADYASVSLFAPDYPALTKDLNNRGPPTLHS